jgi:hypothetical protein
MAKALEVVMVLEFHRHRSLYDSQIHFLVSVPIRQVNTSLTVLNLYGNNLGPEGGKALAKSLQVTSSISLS